MTTPDLSEALSYQQPVPAPPPLEEAPPAPRRNPTIDGLKYAAAAGIVMHHVASFATGPLSAFLVTASLWALFFFFGVSGYFHGEVGNRGVRWLGRRVARLGVPYALWSLIILAWQERAVLRGAPFVLPDPVNTVFFAGAHGILWTLPMLIYCAIIVELIAKNAIARRVLLVGAAALTLAIYWSHQWNAITAMPLVNFILAPRWLLAYVAGMEIRASARTAAPRWIEGLGLGAVVAVGLARLGASLLGGPVYTTLETALWMTVVVLLLWGSHNGLGWFGAARLSWGRDFLIGIYISHVFWLAFVVKVMPPTALPTIIWIPLVWAVCLSGATLTAALLRSNRFTRVMTA